MKQEYFDINKNSWNRKTEFHYNSDFYDNEGFIKGKSSLNDIELKLLGDVKGKSILHLQCHFGQDSISLAKLGAEVTAIDISDQAIEKARSLNEIMKTDVNFINCNVYDISEFLNKQYDVVFTSYGTIGWLPDLNKWASLINQHLLPGGEFVIVEFHPVLWMFDDDFQKISYSYFNKGVILETYEGTYADETADIKQDYAMWNHGLAEVINNLMSKGLKLAYFDEYDFSPYDCFKHTVKVEDKKYRIENLEEKLPMVYSLKMNKPNN